MYTQRIEYDDAIVRKFIFASVLFGARDGIVTRRLRATFHLAR